MDTRKALEALVGKHGLLKIAGNAEIGFTCLAVEQPEKFPPETDRVAFSDVERQCWFCVRLDPGCLIDGREVLRVSGQHVNGWIKTDTSSVRFLGSQEVEAV